MASSFDLAESVRSVHAALRDELRKGLGVYKQYNIYVYTHVHLLTKFIDKSFVNHNCCIYKYNYGNYN